MTDFRIEKDSLGEVKVPVDALYGAQTQRAIENFPVSGIRFPRVFIRALGLIKAAAAEVNAGLGLLDANIAQAIHLAALEVADGEMGRPLPARHLPDRFGDIDEHERQRGDRAAAQRRSSAAQQDRSIRTIT